MSEVYEVIEMEAGSPIKALISSVNKLEMHWHDELEILFILKGSIELRKEEEVYILKEEDVFLLNSKELHSTSRTGEDNIVLALQIQSDYFRRYYPLFADMRFHCNSMEEKPEDKEKFNYVRHFIAKIVYELNKKVDGFELKLNSHINQLSFYLMNNFDYYIVDSQRADTVHRDRIRIENIITYINENIDQKITLTLMAERENINSYYLSHFFKEKVGISFQEYINTVRMQKAVNLLLFSNETITDIALSCGFSSTNYFNKLFRQIYNTTPTKYKNSFFEEAKRESGLSRVSKRTRSYFDVDRRAAFEKLFKYLNQPLEELEKIGIRGGAVESCIILDMNNIKARDYKGHWNNLISFGRAAEGLRKNVQEHIREVQREIPFKNIRFHGIFNDDMMIYHIDKSGRPSYNWTYVDQLFDFLLEVKLKPFIGLGFMPSELKSSQETVYWWKGNISPPKDIKLWLDLVQEFVRHCINRYGLEEVKSWYFEIWNEPELEYIFWAGSREDYFDFFKETFLAVRSISKDIKISGPSISHGTLNNSSWLKDFLYYVKKHKLDLDFVSLHIYPEYIEEEEYLRVIELAQKENTGPKHEDFRQIYYGPNHVIDTIKKVEENIYHILGHKPELHISEWNASSLAGNLIHDSLYVGSYITKNMIDSINTVSSLGYWTLTDLMEEEKLSPSHFHGGFGLINKDGLKKPSYYAYYLLNKLGSSIIGQGDEYIITRQGENIQILVHNFVYFDKSFKSGETSALRPMDRYDIYEEKPNKTMEVQIKGLVGNYKISQYILNRENGSVFDNWVAMGAPENMTKEEVDYLGGISKPKISTKNKSINGEDSFIIHLPPHGVGLISLEKIY